MLSKYWMLKGALLCLLARLDFGEAFTLLVGQQPGGDLRPKLQTRRLSSSEALPEGGGIPPQDGLADGSMGQKTGDLWLPATPTAPSESMVRSVNYFISRACNYSCEFCFHTMKNTNKLSIEEAKRGLKMLRAAGTEKINFAGGEPFLNDIMLGELCKYSHELGMAVSIISNGSLIRPYWMTLYGEFVDVLGVSVDSFDPQTNAAIGRGGDANNQHAERVLRVRALCAEHDIIFKMNTVVCSLNWQEDMADHVRKLDPKRWKVFQVLLLKDENSGGPGELRDARPLVISNDQFWSFVNRHRGKGVDDVLIPEPNDVMQNSYLLLDEELRFLDCSNGGKTPSKSILEVGVEAALMQAGFDDDAFMKRGGVYEWSRARTTSSTSAK